MSAGDGSVSTQVKEDIAELGIKAAGVGEAIATSPINFSGRAEKALINLGVDGFKSRKAFDLWGLLAAHPARADLAAHEAELKGLLKELAAPGLKLDEGIEAQKTAHHRFARRDRSGRLQISARRRQRRTAERDQP